MQVVQVLLAIAERRCILCRRGRDETRGVAGEAELIFFLAEASIEVGREGLG